MSHRNTAVILAAHGSSKDVRINQPMFGLAESIALSGRFGTVTPAFLDGQPAVQWVMDEITQDNVVVIPFMTSCGYYANVVFPQHLHAKHKQVRFAPPIGIHPQLANFVRQNLASILSVIPSGASTQVVVVGHGTRRNKSSCLTTIDLVKDLRVQLPDHRIEFSFIDQRPHVEHVFAKTTAEHVIVVPFLMGLGPHTTVDVPELFGSRDLTSVILNNRAQFPIQWQTQTANGIQKIYYTRPIGTYEVWADICIDLATRQLHTEVAA